MYAKVTKKQQKEVCSVVFNALTSNKLQLTLAMRLFCFFNINFEHSAYFRSCFRVSHANFEHVLKMSAGNNSHSV